LVSIVLVLVVVLVLEKCFTQRVWSTIDASSGGISARCTAPGLEVKPHPFLHVLGRIRSHAPLQILEDEDDDEDENDLRPTALLAPIEHTLGRTTVPSLESLLVGLLALSTLLQRRGQKRGPSRNKAGSLRFRTNGHRRSQTLSRSIRSA
jgi:hypothetical protein